MREITRAHRREIEERIDLQTAMMKAAKVQGHKIKLAAHYPGYLLWFVPDELVDEVGCQAAVVRA